MANNYSDTSVTFVARDATQPFALGPIGTAAMTAMTAWYDSGDGTAFIDDNGPQVESVVAEACLVASGIDRALLGDTRTTLPCLVEVMTAIHEAKPDLVTDAMLKEVTDRFETTTEAEWESVYLEDVIRPFLLEPGANCAGAIEETSWRCDRNRHGEFGGAVYGSTDHVSRCASSSTVLEEIVYADSKLRVYADTPLLAVEFYTTRVREVFGEIKDADTRANIQTSVLTALSNQP